MFEISVVMSSTGLTEFSISKCKYILKSSTYKRNLQYEQPLNQDHLLLFIKLQ